MLYLWSCNQSVACKCRNWNMLRPNILDNKSMEPCKIPEFWELQICIDVTALLHSIWELLSNTLRSHLTTCISSSFFRFLPVSSTFFRKKLEEIPFFQFLPFFREETYFFRKFPNPEITCPEIQILGKYPLRFW